MMKPITHDLIEACTSIDELRVVQEGLRQTWAMACREGDTATSQRATDLMLEVERQIKFLKSRDETINQVRTLCIEGLHRDGDVHKQWFLEQILKTVGEDVDLLHAQGPTSDDDTDYEGGWERGRAP